MTDLVTQDLTVIAGTAIDFSVAPSAGTDTAECGTDGSPRTLLVKNGSGASMNVTIVTPGTVSGLAVADNGPQAVAAGATKGFPLPASLYADPVDRRAHFTTSAQASINVACVRT